MRNLFNSFIVSALLCSTATINAATIDINKAHSKVEIDVKATGDNFTGTLNSYTAALEGNKATKEPTKVTFEWNFANLDTGKEKRNAKMLSWLSNSTTGRFVLTSFTKRNDSRMWAKGTMTINKVDQVIEFPTKGLFKGDSATIRGAATIDTTQFNLPIIKMLGFLTVDPAVKIRFTLRGVIK